MYWMGWAFATVLTVAFGFILWVLLRRLEWVEKQSEKHDTNISILRDWARQKDNHIASVTRVILADTTKRRVELKRVAESFATDFVHPLRTFGSWNERRN